MGATRALPSAHRNFVRRRQHIAVTLSSSQSTADAAASGSVLTPTVLSGPTTIFVSSSVYLRFLLWPVSLHPSVVDDGAAWTKFFHCFLSLTYSAACCILLPLCCNCKSSSVLPIHLLFCRPDFLYPISMFPVLLLVILSYSSASHDRTTAACVSVSFVRRNVSICFNYILMSSFFFLCSVDRQFKYFIGLAVSWAIVITSVCSGMGFPLYLQQKINRSKPNLTERNYVGKETHKKWALIACEHHDVILQRVRLIISPPLNDVNLWILLP